LFADAGVSGGLKKGSLMIAKMQMRLDLDMIEQVPLYLHPSSQLPPHKFLKYKNGKALGTFF
jgi:hypothetical protein